ncbi:unnamed protein product, partial [marine sediment metagenome]
EDMGALLAVMYQGAGYRSAIVLAPNHAAAMVHLPGYKKAIDLTFDGEQGWIWAEATGSTNPFGWFPKEFMAVDLVAYEISAEPISRLKSPDGETPPQPAPIVNSPDVTSMESLFYVVISLIFIIGLVMIIILLMRRRRA